MDWTRKAICKCFHIGMDAFFPLRCFACGQLFRRTQYAADDRFWAGQTADKATSLAGFVCPECFPNVRGIQSPQCTRCGRPFESRHGPDHECDTCRFHAPNYSMARSFGRYEGPLRDLIHYFKYKGCVQLAKPLGHLLWETFNRYWGTGSIDKVIAVPLHNNRLRRRGFNQAGLLVRDLQKKAIFGGMIVDSPGFSKQSLIRQWDTVSQTGLDRVQREKNIRQAFRLSDGATIRNKRVLLVDDVLTTGATANACARVLMQGGAREVLVLTLAHAV